MKRVLVGAAVTGMIAAMLGGATIQASASAHHIATHPATMRLVGVVDVGSLPKVTGHKAGTGTMRSIPLRTAPGSAGAAVPVGRTAATNGRSPLFSFAKGTVLPSPLKDSDNTSGLTPPDMGVGADSTHVVQMVNVVGKIWTGGVAGAAFQLSSFFLAGTHFVSDPWVFFDQESGRWFAGIFDVTNGGERIAVSTTGNPTGSWFVYSVQYPGAPGGGCPDQGKGGVDSDILALGFNEFSGVGCTGGFLGAANEYFNKSQMIAGASVNFCYTNPDPTFFSLIPAQALTPGMTTMYLASVDSSIGTLLHRITSVGVPSATGCNTLTGLADLTVKKYNNPPAAPQPGTATKLASGDHRMQHVVQKVVGTNTELLMTWGDKCKPAGDTTARACARVTATNETAGTLLFSKDVATLGAYNVYPAATWNSSNDIVVAFGQCSSSIMPQLMASASKGTMAFQAPIVLNTGTNPNTTGRYGDYFAVAQDPANLNNIWTAGEIGGPVNNDWQTAVVEVNVTP
jgi:hypothetical protein